MTSEQANQNKSSAEAAQRDARALPPFGSKIQRDKRADRGKADALQQDRHARLPDQADDLPEGLPLSVMLEYVRDRKGYHRRAGRQENGYRADKREAALSI